MVDWEWFSSPTTSHLFLYFLIKASTEDKKWKGMVVKRGQLIASRESVCKSTGLTPREYRTAIKRLSDCNAISVKTTNRFTLITICKYESYQQRDESCDQPKTNERPTKDQPKTTS